MLVLAEVLWTCVLKDVEVQLSLKNEGRVSKLGVNQVQEPSHESKRVQIIF